MRLAARVGLLIAMVSAACGEPTDPSGVETTSTALRIVAILDATGREQPQAARATVVGATTLLVDLDRTAAGFETTIEGVTPGTYRVVVEGLSADRVTFFGDIRDVIVAAGETVDAELRLSSFVPVLQPFSSPSTALAVRTVFTEVSHATGYVAEVNDSPNFEAAERTALSSSGEVLMLPNTGSFYVRVRATNDMVGVDAAAPSAFLSIEVLTDRDPSGDDLVSAVDLGVSGAYEELNIAPSDDEDWFAVDVTQGDVLAVEVDVGSLDPPSALDARLVLVDVNGVVILAAPTDVPNGTRHVAFPAVIEGKHYIRVSGGGRSIGHYRLAWQVTPGAAQSVPYTVIEEVHTTAWSGIEDRRRSVIRDADAWEQFWSELNQVVVPVPETPAIDFAQNMVLVASVGQQPTGGYHIAIEEVAENDALSVLVLEVSPGAECPVTDGHTAPVTAVVVPRTDAPVAFVDQHATASCP